MDKPLNPVTRIWNLVRDEKSDITAIYFYAALNGLIQLSIPVGIQAIIGFVIGGTLRASLVVLIVVIVTAVFLAGMMQVNQMRIIERIQQRIFVRYAYAFADRIPRLDLKKIDAFYLPELVNRFFDTAALQKSLSKVLLEFPTAMIQILFGLILLSFYHPFFILFGILLLLLLWLMVYTTGHRGLQSSLAESTYKYGLAEWFEEMARLAKSFKFAYTTGLHLKKADDKTIRYIDARTKHFSVLLLQYRTLVAFKVAISAAMLIAGVFLLLDQQINIGQFVAAEIIILTVINSVEKIIVNLDSAYDTLTAVEKIGKLTDKPVESSGTFQLSAPGGLKVEAQKLSFAYESGHPIINNVNFVISPGEKACITGSDGSGKSTLLKLLTGVYNDFSGSLLFNEVPIGNYDLLKLREQMGIIFLQENVFKGTLWENLTMGRNDIDQDYVSYLCNQAGLNAFIASMPTGFDTLLDPTGKRLPRNVIQKILVVRALAHKPKLLVMEDPCMGIESVYKQNIYRLLKESSSTVIAATNDESFMKLCDRRIDLYSKS